MYGNLAAKAAGDRAVATWKNKDLNWKQFDVVPSEPEKIVERVNVVSWNIWANFERTNENMIMVPYLVILPLASLYLSARGETKDQLRELLGFTGDEQEDFKLHKWFLYAHMRITQQSKRSRVAPINVLLMKPFPIENVQPEIRDLLMRYIREVSCLTMVETLKNCEQDLNRKIKRESYGKLEVACPPNYLDEDSTMAMVSSLYFAGDWMNLPNDGYAKIDVFHVSETVRKKCAYINSETRADYWEFPDCTVCGFEIKWSSLTFYFFLPKERFKLAEFEKTLTGASMLHMIRYTARRRVYKQHFVIVQIPKFKMMRSFDLIESVKKLNVPNLFDKNRLDLGNLSPDLSHRSLENVYQSVGIETRLNSGNLMVLVKEPRKVIPGLPVSKVFKVDSPFIFVLFEHRSELIVYIGRFLEPEEIVA